MENENAIYKIEWYATVILVTGLTRFLPKFNTPFSTKVKSCTRSGIRRLIFLNFLFCHLIKDFLICKSGALHPESIAANALVNL